jgi:hypothetical protein
MVATPSKALFHSVAVGFMLGVGIFMLAGFILVVVASPASQHMGWGTIVGMALFLPVAIVLNAYLTAAFVMLGLWLLAKLRGSTSAGSA